MADDLGAASVSDVLSELQSAFSTADAELEQLNAAFKISVKPAHFFLGNNITVHGAAQVGAP